MFPHDYNDALIWMFFYSLEALALILNQSYPQVDVFALSDGLGMYVYVTSKSTCLSKLFSNVKGLE